MRLSKATSAAPSGSHDEEDPCWDGKETLQLSLAPDTRCEIVVEMLTYHCEGPAIPSSDLCILCIENTNLQTPCDQGYDDLERVKAQFQVGDDVGVDFKPHIGG